MVFLGPGWSCLHPARSAEGAWQINSGQHSGDYRPGQHWPVQSEAGNQIAFGACPPSRNPILRAQRGARVLPTGSLGPRRGRPPPAAFSPGSGLSTGTHAPAAGSALPHIPPKFSQATVSVQFRLASRLGSFLSVVFYGLPGLWVPPGPLFQGFCFRSRGCPPAANLSRCSDSASAERVPGRSFGSLFSVSSCRRPSSQVCSPDCLAPLLQGGPRRPSSLLPEPARGSRRVGTSADLGGDQAPPPLITFPCHPDPP